MNWREWFKEYFLLAIGAKDNHAVEETRYQAFKSRLIEELLLDLPETPEERAAWIENMVAKKEPPPNQELIFTSSTDARFPTADDRKILPKCPKCWPNGARGCDGVGLIHLIVWKPDR